VHGRVGREPRAQAVDVRALGRVDEGAHGLCGMLAR
jgi:hypothetical protein